MTGKTGKTGRRAKDSPERTREEGPEAIFSQRDKGKVSDMNTIQVALVGCGRISQVHVDAIVQTEGIQLVAVCDVDKTKTLSYKEKYKVSAYGQIDPILRDEKIDLVVIATPNGTHYPLAKACFQAGKSILLEKPITIHTKDAIDLIQEADRRKARFFAVKQVRYNPSIQLLKQYCDAGRLGRLFSASLVVRWTRPQAYYDQSDWRGTKALDGGSLLNQGVHYVDIMQWILGDAASVFGYKETCCHDIEIEDIALGLVRFQNGASGTIEFNVNSYPNNLECSLTVLGEKGSVKLAGAAMNEIEFWHVQDCPKPSIPSGFSPYVYAGGLYQGSCPNHIYVYRDIVRALKDGDEWYVDGREALKSLQIVNALYESAEKRKEIRLG
jgi:UDP-N-acetyl-2-amino-2-deoxyglucuronate dehydrogenase